MNGSTPPTQAPSSTSAEKPQDDAAAASAPIASPEAPGPTTGSTLPAAADSASRPNAAGPSAAGPSAAGPSADSVPVMTRTTCAPGREPLLARVLEVLKTVYDPEIPVNIWELGLVYDIIVQTDSTVGIRMTLTAPACPAAQYLPGEVRRRVSEVPGVTGVKLDVVWDPPWDRDRMSDAAKLQLGLF